MSVRRDRSQVWPAGTAGDAQGHLFSSSSVYPVAPRPLWIHLPPFSLAHAITRALASLLLTAGSLRLLRLLPAMLSPHPDALTTHPVTSSPLVFQCLLFREALPNYLIPNGSCFSPCPPCIAGEPDDTYLLLTLDALGYVPVDDGPLPCFSSLKAGITPGFAHSKLTNL